MRVQVCVWGGGAQEKVAGGRAGMKAADSGGLVVKRSRETDGCEGQAFCCFTKGQLTAF